MLLLCLLPMVLLSSSSLSSNISDAGDINLEVSSWQREKICDGIQVINGLLVLLLVVVMLLVISLSMKVMRMEMVISLLLLNQMLVES